MRHAMVCDIGKIRSINQDAVFSASCKDVGLFVVADGMGGHSHGEKASQQIVQKIAEWWETFVPERYDNDFGRMMISLKQAVERANWEIYENYNRSMICGSTIVLLFIYEDNYGVIYAGDSRIYLYHGWKLQQLTMDEIWENQPNLTETERKAGWEQFHGRLFNAVGIYNLLQCTLITGRLQPGMVFLLCSDGLYKYCPKRHLKKCMKRAKRVKELETDMAELLSRVYASEAADNISAILVAVA